MRSISLAVMAVAAFVWSLGACSAEVGDADTPGYRLRLIGESHIDVKEFDVHVMRVHYVDGLGHAVSDSVRFEIDGAADGAMLSATAVETDRHGFAEIQVHTARATSFDVVARSERASDPARLQVTVHPISTGALEYTATYAGFRDLEFVETAVYRDLGCVGVYEQVPMPWAAKVGPVGVRMHFPEVPFATRLAVLALGVDTNDDVAATACREVELERPTQFVHLQLIDVDDTDVGTYTALERVDLTNGSMVELERLLRHIRELLLDPTATLVRRVAEAPTTPAWIQGNLANFMEQRRVAESLKGAANRSLGEAYLSHVARAADELDGALDNVLFEGVLTLTAPDSRLAVSGHHRIERYSMEVGDQRVDRIVGWTQHVDGFLGGRVGIEAHEFRVPLGEMVDAALHTALARIPGSPTSVQSLARAVLACEEIPSPMHTCAGSTEDNLAHCTCVLGRQLSWSSYDTAWVWEIDRLRLQMSASLADTDGDYVRDTFERGATFLRFHSGRRTDVLNALGTFEGTLIGERAAPLSSLRDRIERVI